MEIILKNPSIDAKLLEPVTVGVPCPKGTVVKGGSWVLNCSYGHIPVQTSPLTFWPNNSVRWLLCDFLATMKPKEELHLELEPRVSERSQGAAIQCNIGSEQVVIDTGRASFILNSKQFTPFQQVFVGGENQLVGGGEIWLLDEGNYKRIPLIENIEIETVGAVRLTLKIMGRFDTKKELLFQAKLHFFAGTAKCQMEFTLHNPQPAHHPGGIWDLGDPASFLFKELVASLTFDAGSDFQKMYKLAPEEDWSSCNQEEEVIIYQESSGGNQWDSPTHRNRNGIVPMKFNGYRLYQGAKIIGKGYRAQPAVWVGGKGNNISLVLPKFWQEFPKAINIKRQSIDISFYPGIFPDMHELQGGEQKTHVLYIDFDSKRETSVWGESPIETVLVPQAINESAIFKNLNCGAPVSEKYQEYLDAALEGPSSFYAKRELVDEYGWRNFGELYADHEAVFHVSEGPFVSHYNNQYDPLASFYREFFRTGDSRWAELAENLASHVVDVDLNNTTLDREEYCHGLFWHTDHYLDAGLSTHRCVSKEHLKGKNPLYVGGGPGAQHCYTTGLMYQYLFSGNSRYKKAAILMAEWSYVNLKGPQTVLAAFLRGLKNFKKKLRNDTFWSEFPLDRGTGNCLNASLDAYELTGLRKYIDRAIGLVRGTVHPADSIDARDLLQAEEAWSYTVFLISLIRFIEVKETLGELDDDFEYAKDCLLHYANWMTENERLYLEKSDMLEYPNETWLAQEFRKSVVLYHAIKFARTEHVQKIRQRCQFFMETAFSDLSSWDTRFLTRPLVLVLQNGWLDLDSDKYSVSHLDPIEHEWGCSPFVCTFSEIIRKTISDMWNCACSTSVDREWHWLRSRLGVGR